MGKENASSLYYTFWASATKNVKTVIRKTFGAYFDDRIMKNHYGREPRE